MSSVPEKSPPANVHELWLSLDARSRAQFVRDARSTENYVKNNVVYGRKWPKLATVERVALACNKAGLKTTTEDLLIWFYRRNRAAVAVRRQARRRGLAHE